MDDNQTIRSLFDDLPYFELPNATGYIHEPQVAPMYYRYLLYHPLNETHLSEFLQSSSFHIVEALVDFYKQYNGLRLNQKVSIFGSLLNRGFQPISLDYGNLYERPANLPGYSTVIGGLTLSENNNGYLVAHEDRSVTCTSSFLIYDEIRKWPDIETLVRDELQESLDERIR